MKPQGAGGTCLHGTGCTCTAGGGVKIKNRADGVSKSIFSGYRRHRHERPGPLFPARGEKGGRLRPYSFAPDGRVVGRGGGDPFRGRRAADPRGVPRPGGDDGGVYPGRAAGARRVPLFRRPRVPYREALADVGAPRRRQVRDGRGGDARQDYDVDARGMAQPRPDGWRQCLSGRYLEEFRRQPGAGRLRGAEDAPARGEGMRRCRITPSGRAAGRRGRRVRPFVPAALSRCGGGYVGRRRPPRHLRDARGGEGGFRAVRAADTPRRIPRHQARGRHCGGQSADYGVPLFVRRAVRLLCP